MDRSDVFPLDDVSPADWLLEQLVGFGGHVEHVVPTSFEAVARILHQDDHDPTESRLWSEIAAFCGTTLHPVAQYWMLAGHHDRSLATRRWPETRGEPAVGSLDRRSLLVLRDVLAPHTMTPETCWFALWEGWGNLPPTWRDAAAFEPPGRRHHLFTGALADVAEISNEFACAGRAFEPPAGTWVVAYAVGTTPESPDWRQIADDCRESGGGQSPSLWWPEDRSWCVASEIDFDSTLVAGSAALVAELTAHPDLEAFEVAPGDSLQYDGDPVNMR